MKHDCRKNEGEFGRLLANAAAELDSTARHRRRWYLPIAAASLFGLMVIYGNRDEVHRSEPSSLGSTAGSVGNGTAVAMSTSCPVPFSFRCGENNIRNYHQHKAGGKTVNSILSTLTAVSGESVNYRRYRGGEIHGNRKKLKFYTKNYGGKGTDRYITFVREPVSKIMSRFYYHRDMCNGTSWLKPSWKLAGVCCLDLGQYVVERALNNNQYESLIAGNLMKAVCSPSDPEAKFEASWRKIRRGKPKPEDVCPAGREAFIQRAEQILANLSERVFIGIVERWDESLLLFAALGGFDPESVKYCRKNARYGTPKPRDLQDGAWGERGKEIFKTVTEYNALDAAVYEAVTRLFERQKSCWNSASRPGMSINTGLWQNESLVPFQKANCPSKESKGMYNAKVMGVPDGKLIDPSYFVPYDLPFMLSRAKGNRTCPELLKKFSDCPYTQFLEPC